MKDLTSRKENHPGFTQSEKKIPFENTCKLFCISIRYRQGVHFLKNIFSKLGTQRTQRYCIVKYSRWFKRAEEIHLSLSILIERMLKSCASTCSALYCCLVLSVASMITPNKKRRLNLFTKWLPSYVFSLRSPLIKKKINNNNNLLQICKRNRLLARCFTLLQNKTVALAATSYKISHLRRRRLCHRHTSWIRRVCVSGPWRCYGVHIHRPTSREW